MAYVKAKSLDHLGQFGPDQFFDTIKNDSDERVQRAWRAACGDDTVTIESALKCRGRTIPQVFLEKWNRALIAAFGPSYTFKTVTSIYQGGKHDKIKGDHVYKLKVKGDISPPPPTPSN